MCFGFPLVTTITGDLRGDGEDFVDELRVRRRLQILPVGRYEQITARDPNFAQESS